MEIKDFYTFRSKLLGTAFHAASVGLNLSNDGTGMYDEHYLIMGSNARIKYPVMFKQEGGEGLTDVLDTGWPGLYLISDRLKNILEENSLSGWHTFSISLISKDDRVISGYFGLSILGRCGPISYDNCETIQKQMSHNGPVTKYYKGLYIGLDKWDGTVFFLPEKNYGAIVTEKAMRSMINNGVTNIQFTNLADIETPEFAVK